MLYELEFHESGEVSQEDQKDGTPCRVLCDRGYTVPGAGTAAGVVIDQVSDKSHHVHPG